MRGRDARAAAESGTATIAVLAFLGVVLTVALAASAVLAAAVAHRRAQAAADLAVLAAAATHQQRGDTCDSGAQVAAANGGRLAACRVVGDDVLVVVAVAVPGDNPFLPEVSARARAGPG